MSYGRTHLSPPTRRVPLGEELHSLGLNHFVPEAGEVLGEELR
jgi:hypothetical protein